MMRHVFKNYGVWALSVVLLATLGCEGIEHNKVLPKTVVPITMAFFGGNLTAELDSLEEKHKQATEKYEQSVASYRGSIKRTMDETNEALEREDIWNAIKNIVYLYSLTHPCGEDICRENPCESGFCTTSSRLENGLPPISSFEAYMQLEDIGSEREFILKSVDRAYELIDKLQKERRFNSADVTLTKYGEMIPGPPENKARFEAKHQELKQAWVDTLVADAVRLEKSNKFGAAAIMYGKASMLANTMGKEDTASKLAAQSKAAGSKAVKKYRYRIDIGSSSGPHASEFTSALRSMRFDGAVGIGGGGNGTISLSTGTPKYKRYDDSTTGSFKYKSGTKEESNPAYSQKEAECERDRDDLETTTRQCNEDGDAICGFVDSSRRDLEQCLAELAETPQTVTVDIFDVYEYPIKLLVLDVAMDINATLEHKDGRKAISYRGAKAKVSDKVHDAHQKNDGSVAADGADPPTKEDAYSKLSDIIKSNLGDVVMESFEQYRAQLASKHSDGSEDELDMLAVYVLLRPSTVLKERAERLDKVSGITGAVETLTKLP